jgi:hypothetical protein
MLPVVQADRRRTWPAVDFARLQRKLCRRRSHIACVKTFSRHVACRRSPPVSKGIHHLVVPQQGDDDAASLLSLRPELVEEGVKRDRVPAPVHDVARLDEDGALADPAASVVHQPGEAQDALGMRQIAVQIPNGD